MDNSKPPRISPRERLKLVAEHRRLHLMANVYPANPTVNYEGMPWVDCLIETPKRHWHMVLGERDQKYRRLGRVPPALLFVNGEEVDVEFYLKKYHEENPS